MAKPPRMEAALLEELDREATKLAREGGVAVIRDGRRFTAAELPQLADLVRVQRVRAAIEAIEGGAQSYSIEGRTFQKGDLRALYERLDLLESRAVMAARGGAARVRQIVPGL